MYTKSILQWEFFVWSSLRTHYSLYLFILMFWIRTGIFWINHFFILFPESPTFNYCGRLWSGRSFGTNWKGFIGLWSKGPGYIKRLIILKCHHSDLGWLWQCLNFWLIFWCFPLVMDLLQLSDSNFWNFSQFLSSRQS